MKKFISALSLIVLFVFNATAQINTAKPVGVLDGQSDVSLDGAANYTIPVKLPKGIAGMQPSLSLAYNSRTTDGLAGWGWNLSGVSCITRGNQTRYHNGLTNPMRMNADDNFYLDGQLLMPTSGSNGGNGTVYETEAKNYAKIESFGTINGDPEWWKVTSKDGSIVEYGVQATGRLRATANFSWFISIAKDVSNNTITYNYQQYDNEIFLDNISYANALVQLSYTYKQNPNVAFVAGTAFKGTRILNKITINLNGARQLDYVLTHEIKIKRHYLKSVELVGTDNSINNAVVTNFDYGNPDTEEGSSMTTGYYPSNNIAGVTLSPGDFNGDGRTDLLVSDKTAWVHYDKDYNQIIDSVTSSRYDIISDVIPNSIYSAINLAQNNSLPAATYIKQNELISPYVNYPTDFNGNGKDGIVRQNIITHTFPDSRGGMDQDGMSYTEYLATDNFEANGAASLNINTQNLSLPTDSYNRTYNFYLKESNSSVQGDFDGDGKGDFISILGYKWKSGTYSTRVWIFPTGWRYTYHDIYTYNYKAFFTNTSNGYYNSEILNIGDEVRDAKAVYPIDFDGDGKQEIIVFKPHGYIVYAINNLPASSGHRFQATQILNASNIYYSSYKQVMTGDFNGDKKTDFACISNNSYYATIFYSTGTDFKEGSLPLQYAPNFNYSFTQLSGATPRPPKFMVGDFNGDGLADIYQSDTYTESYSYPGGGNEHSFDENGGYDCKNGTCTFYTVKQRQAVYYTKGVSVYQVPGSGETMTICEEDWPYFSSIYPDAQIIYVDYDGSCIDPQYGQIMATYTIEYNFNTVDAYAPAQTIYTSQYNINNTPYFSLNIGDFNGDGKMELIQGDKQQYYMINATNGIDFNKDVSLLQKVTDGFGNETKFDYQSIAEKSNDPVYATTGQLSSNYPINVMSVPIKVVKSVTAPDGIGGTTATSYKYEDLVLDRQKGFLGFRKTIVSNAVLNTKAETESQLNTQYRLLLPQSSKSYVNNTLISESQSTPVVSTVPVNSTRYYTNFNRLKVQAQSGVEINHLSNAAVKTENQYDAYDNPVQQTVKTGTWNGSDVAAIETATTSTQYIQTGKALVPIFPSQVTVSNTRNGVTSSKVNTMTYTADRGLPETKVSWSGTPLANTTTYSYDSYGNLTQSVSSVASHPVATTTVSYDASHRFAINTVTTVAGISKTQSAVYHDLWGVPISQTDGDGTAGSLTTSFEYDALGKLKKTTTPLGHVINESDVWDVSGQQAYYHYTDYPDGVGADTKVWHDRAGRPIKRQTLGWNNQWATDTTTYNNKGQAVTATAPYYTGEEQLTTTTQYDALNRVMSSIAPNGTSTVSYSYAGDGTITITSTTPAGQVSSKTTDATGQAISTTDHGGTVNYTYDERGNLKTTVVNGVAMQTLTYDGYGRKTQLTDANAGTVTYQYDERDLLTQQTDANNKVTTIAYDGLGRITGRTTQEGTITYEYYNTANNKALWKVYNANHTREIVYDNYRRVTSQAETITGTGTFTTSYQYDANDNLAATTYPNNVTVSNTYNNAGMLQTVTSGGKILYNATGYNGLGQATGYTLVNGMQSSVTYNKGLPQHYYTPGVQDLNFNFTLTTGNLASRTDAIKNLTETFTYDNLDRLTSATVNGVQQFGITYDNNAGQSKGNIAAKSDIGNYTYQSAKPNAVAYISPVTQEVEATDNNLAISYTAFHRPLQITKPGIATLDLIYGVDDERVKTVQTNVGGGQETRLFLGSYEIQTLPNGVVNHIVYVAGGNGLCAMIVNGVPHAVYTDYLGSILKITNEYGATVAEQNFDAWGRRRNVDNWTYVNVQQLPAWLYRGYTGHEHLDALGLINMNARLYDPMTGRMLSPDNYSGYFFGTQGMNPFSYANNNPLKYTDPDGEWVHIVVGAVVGGVFNLISNWDEINSFGEGLGYFFSGAAGGAVTAATGQPALGGLITGGANAALAGGKFIDVARGAIMGGATGALGGVLGTKISSLISPLIQQGASSVFGPVMSRVLTELTAHTITGAAVGGTMSFMTGGSFVEGAVSGAKFGLMSGAVSGTVKGIETHKAIKAQLARYKVNLIVEDPIITTELNIIRERIRSETITESELSSAMRKYTQNELFGDGNFTDVKDFKYDGRVRDRALQDPQSHNFPYSYDKSILSFKPEITETGYRYYRAAGSMNRYYGYFEIGVTKSGVIDHRYFKPLYPIYKK